VEDLRIHFGRSPDPDKIEDEMQRDKGYGGARSMKRRGLHLEEACPLAQRRAVAPSKISEGSRGDNGIGGMEHGAEASTDQECDIASPGKSAGGNESRTPLSDALEREAYVESLQKRLEELEARAATSILLSTPTELRADDSRDQMPPHSEGPKQIYEETVSFLTV